MTIQTTNIDAGGDAVDLTSGDEDFFTITNGVVIESQAGRGIVADNTQNFFIYNYGSIVANEPGVELESTNYHFYNERAGSVFGFEAVVMTTADETFVNYGDVSGDIIGVSDTSGGNVILNYGTIEGPSESLVVAGRETITNARGGLIDGAITLVAGGDTLTNAGDIDGAITFTGTSITNTVTNSGEITGNIKFSATHSTLTNTGSITGDITIAAAGTLVNHGQIYGNVAAAGNATLTNTGVIHGNVRLGAHDTFTVGDVTGAVTISTNDVLAFSGNFGNVTIDKFVAGSGTTHDVISFASNDFSTFAQVHAASTQQGADVVIRLDGTDSITLVGVALSHLVSADFKFV
jgi:cytoskeletal protein CcmA (bactofilin family)